MTVSDYIDYFRTLAEEHYLLRHDPLTETGGGRAIDRHFGWYNSMDVLTGLRFAANWPALLVEVYEWEMRAATTYDLTAEYPGAFSVFVKADTNKPGDDMAATILAETIMMHMVHRLYQDHYGFDKERCNTPFQQLYLAGANIVHVGPVFDNCYGWRCEFRFRPRQAYNFNTPVSEGIFISP